MLDWLTVCDLAMCAPDNCFSPAELVARATKYGTALTEDRANQAHAEWRERARGKEHHVGTIRLS